MTAGQSGQLLVGLCLCLVEVSAVDVVAVVAVATAAAAAAADVAAVAVVACDMTQSGQF